MSGAWVVMPKGRSRSSRVLEVRYSPTRRRHIHPIYDHRHDRDPFRDGQEYYWHNRNIVSRGKFKNLYYALRVEEELNALSCLDGALLARGC